MVDDQIKVTHDNNGRFYRIKMDLAKEGSEIWDLTPYFKGRVGDNRFGLQVVWTYQGRLLDTTGMKPYIEGNVGNYSFDDKKELQLAPDAATVRYTGDPSDCQSGGRATYYFPEQMFPRDGIFKGYIGLLDDRDDSSQPHISGVTVWFRVLPNIAQMGHACDVYISDLDKALQNFKVKLDQHDKDYQTQLQQVIDNARNTYETETQNAHDSLIALNSEIQNNRDFQHALNEQLKGTQDQIRINDVVRRQEFEDLSGKINEQLAHMNFQPDYYLNYQDMTAKNPQGTHNACVTTDNYHIWLYNFDTNQWQDGGQMTNYGLDPQTKNAVATSNPNNLIYDSDFKLSNSWLNGGNGKPLVADIYQHNSMNGSNIMSLSEIDKGASFSSQPFPVKNHSQVSFGVWANLTHAVGRVDMAICGDNDDNSAFTVISRMTIPNSPDDDLHFIYSEYCFIPKGITKIWVAFEMNDKGTLLICRPQVNFGNHLLPYSLQEIESDVNVLKTQVGQKNENLLLNPDFYTLNHWTVSQEGLTAELSKDAKFNNSNVVTLHNPDDTPRAFTSDNVNNPNTEDNFLSLGFWAKLSDDCSPYIDVWWNQSDKFDPQLQFIADGKWHFYDVLSGTGMWVQLKIASSIKVDFVLKKKGTLEIARPQMNWGHHLLPYSVNEIVIAQKLNDNSNNLLYDPNFDLDNSWANEPNGKPLQIELLTTDELNKSKLAKITEVDAGGSYSSRNIDVGQHKSFSFGALVNATGCQKDAMITIWSDNTLLTSIDIPNSGDNQLKLYKKENCHIPDGTSNIRLCMTLPKGGTVEFARPYLNWGEKLLSDSNKNVASGLPQLNIKCDEDITDSWLKAPFTYQDKKRQVNGYLQISIQGDSSRLFPKKNYKIKCFSDKDYKSKLEWRPKSSWNANNKFNLKANWVDATQARNLINARIFERASDVTPFENDQVAEKLSHAQAMGQMEGFPIEVYLDGQYNGLYTLNTKKDDKTFGMDSDNEGDEAITFETTGSNLRKYPAKIDGTDYATVVHDQANSTLITNFNNFLKFLNESTDDTIKSDLNKYIDVHSVINTYLWGVLAEVWDTSAKSNLLLTYNNGAYWYMTPYDMDSTWSLKPDGNIYDVPLPEYDFKNIDNDQYMQFVTEKNDMKLFNIVYRLFKPELQKQYFKLRQDVWSNSKIIDEYKRFIDSIPQDAYEREHNRWPNIPSINKNNFAQIQSAIIQRGSQMDAFMDNLVPTVDLKQQFITHVAHESDVASQTAPIVIVDD